MRQGYMYTIEGEWIKDRVEDAERPTAWRPFETDDLLPDGAAYLVIMGSYGLTREEATQRATEVCAWLLQDVAHVRATLWHNRQKVYSWDRV